MMIFAITWSVWFISEIMLNRLFRSNKDDKQNLDRASLRIIWITIGIANSLGILSAVLIDLPISNYFLIPCLGLLIIVCGIILRFISIISLGKFFTVDVTIRKDHKIIKEGMYQFIRHPSYTGSLVSFLGFGLSLNNWVSLVIIFLPVFLAMLHRIKIEEKFLTDQFGMEYIDYQKNTYRLIPWIY